MQPGFFFDFLCPCNAEFAVAGGRGRSWPWRRGKGGQAPPGHTPMAPRLACCDDHGMAMAGNAAEVWDAEAAAAAAAPGAFTVKAVKAVAAAAAAGAEADAEVEAEA